jgi:hypothetical protein
VVEGETVKTSVENIERTGDMADTSTALDMQRWTPFVTFGNILVSAMVAIIATWLAHKFTDDRERRKEAATAEQSRRHRLCEKLEQMIAALYEYVDEQGKHGLYVASLGIFSGTGAQAPDEPLRADMPPKSRAEMLQRLYFPELKELMFAMTVAGQPLNKFWSDELSAIGADANQWRATGKLTYTTRQTPLLFALSQSVNNLADAARDKITALSADMPRQQRPATLRRVWTWACGLWTRSPAAAP